MAALPRTKSARKPTPSGRGPGRPPVTAAGDDAATRRHILDAALESFSAHGFDGASIAAIAQAHRVSPSLLHYYFKTKEELWRAAVEHGIGSMMRELQQLMDELSDMDCIGKLKFFIRRFIALMAERPAVFRLMVRESEVRSPRLTWLAKRYLQPYYKIMSDLVEDAQRQGRLKADAPPYHMSQIIAGACYQFLGSRNRLLETFGTDVATREMREKHTQVVIDVLFNGMLVAEDAH